MPSEIETMVPAPTAAPPKITLAALVRTGCEGTTQAIKRFAYVKDGTLFMCASGAARHGAGMIRVDGHAVIEADGTATLMPVSYRRYDRRQQIVDKMLRSPAPPPPCGHEFTNPDTEGLMIHLNDEHHLTREAIAAYLEEWMR